MTAGEDAVADADEAAAGDVCWVDSEMGGAEFAAGELRGAVWLRD